MHVSAILEEKGDRVVTVTPAATVSETAKTLRQERIGAVVVLGEDGALAGIVSERDIVRGIAEHGDAALSMPVSELMSRSVVTCGREHSTEDLMEQMNAKRIRHLPVVDNGAMVGIVSVSDVVKSVLSELQWRADVLREQVVTAAMRSTDDDD